MMKKFPFTDKELQKGSLHYHQDFQEQILQMFVMKRQLEQSDKDIYFARMKILSSQ